MRLTNRVFRREGVGMGLTTFMCLWRCPRIERLDNSDFVEIYSKYLRRYFCLIFVSGSRDIGFLNNGL